MILDSLKNAKLYYGVGERFKQAFDYIESTNLAALPIGKTEIDGKNLYVAVSEYETKDELLTFEAHDRYADIQVVIFGNERIDWCERKDTTVAIEYNADKDAIRLDGDNYTQIKIKEGQFAIFYPEDAHRPNLTDDKKTTVKKAVFKVLL